MKVPLLLLPPNRVRRNYTGGATLDGLAGESSPRDTNRPEDWIASTTRATNPGMEAIADEGISRIPLPDGRSILLSDLLAAEGEYYLGCDHLARLGPTIGFLAKFLDSSIRLHVQAHPTAQFARQHLNSRYGKLETYVILGHRPGTSPYIRLGFQRPPTPEEWKRIVYEQDIPAMDACFDRIPVTEGETWLVPGGLPHAIGEGVLMLEVMEPTDLVVRCEFEREGIVVPPAGRFMGRDPDFAMGIFDYTPLPVEAARRKCRIEPRVVRREPNLLEERVIGPEQTDCFTIDRLTVTGPTTLPPTSRLRLAIVASGTGEIGHGQDARATLRAGGKVLIAAGAEPVEITTQESPLQLLLCAPGAL